MQKVSTFRLFDACPEFFQRLGITAPQAAGWAIPRGITASEARAIRRSEARRFGGRVLEIATDISKAIVAIPAGGKS